MYIYTYEDFIYYSKPLLVEKARAPYYIDYGWLWLPIIVRNMALNYEYRVRVLTLLLLYIYTWYFCCAIIYYDIQQQYCEVQNINNTVFCIYHEWVRIHLALYAVVVHNQYLVHSSQSSAENSVHIHAVSGMKVYACLMEHHLTMLARYRPVAVFMWRRNLDRGTGTSTSAPTCLLYIIMWKILNMYYDSDACTAAVRVLVTHSSSSRQPISSW